MADPIVTPVDPETPPILTGEKAVKLLNEVKDDLVPVINDMIAKQSAAQADYTGYVAAQQSADKSMTELLASQEEARAALTKTSAETVAAAHQKWAVSDAQKTQAEKLFRDEINYVVAEAGGDENAVDPTPAPAPVPEAASAASKK